MTYTIPDILIEQKDPGLVEIEAGLYLERMRSTTQPLFHPPARGHIQTGGFSSEAFENIMS